MRITFVTRKLGNVERNSHCDVLHITPIRVARLFLDCNGDFAIKAYTQQTCLRWANVGKRWHRRGDDVGPTLFRRRLATSQYDAKPTSGDDVGSTLFRRRLATSQYDAKPTSGDDVGSTLFRRRLATSQYDAKPTSGDDVGSTLFPRR